MSKIGDFLKQGVGSIASKVLKAGVTDIVKGAGRASNVDVGPIASGAGEVLDYNPRGLFTPSAPPSIEDAPASSSPATPTTSVPAPAAEKPMPASTGEFRPVAVGALTSAGAELPKARLTEALVNRLLLTQPAGADLLTLLPLQVGIYTRERGLAHGQIATDPVNVTYSGNGEAVSVTVVSCWDADEARDKLDPSKSNLDNSRGSVQDGWLAGIDSRGVVFTWARNSFRYEVVSPRGVSPIARFLGAFPY